MSANDVVNLKKKNNLRLVPPCIISERKLLVIIHLHLNFWPIKIDISWGFVTINWHVTEMMEDLHFKYKLQTIKKQGETLLPGKTFITNKNLTQITSCTSQKTNIAPDQWWLQNYVPFSGDILNSRGGMRAFEKIYKYNQIYTTNCMYVPYSVWLKPLVKSRATPCGPIWRNHRFDSSKLLIWRRHSEDCRNLRCPYGRLGNLRED